MKLAPVGDLTYPGSAKDIFALSGTDDIAFRFLKNFSVFDIGRSKDEIPGKDQAVCACAVKSFEIAREIGVPTHFVEQLDPITMRVHRAQTITDRPLTAADSNYVVPIELIYRLHVAGSIERAFRAGTKKPEDYGLPAGIPAVGTPFPYPVHHLTTKFEKTDRDITFEEACEMAGITAEDVLQYWSMIDRLTGATGLHLARNGLAVLDGKMECLMGPNREKIIADVFVTPDEDRPVLLADLQRGVIKHLGKEYLRQYFIEIGYFDKLKTARTAGQDDIPLPKLPEEIIAEASRRYITMGEAYGGVTIAA